MLYELFLVVVLRLSLWSFLLFWSTDLDVWASVAVAHGLSMLRLLGSRAQAQ